ncbi:MAG: asparagine synthase (glutamine-hydrolyzing), partial [Bacteroidota bacterium]
MCGITGIVAFRPEGKPFQQQVGNALQTLHQRGPDHQAEETYRHVTLGHARLAVIDTSNAGNQPMTDPTGRYTIVFNGEFYNFRKLRQQLEQQGVVFQSQSDTEVLLQLYIRRGPVCLRSINGFFSLAIYDRELDTLFMARDRLGIKPLLYYQDQDKLIFASEMKAMLAYTIPREIDRVSLFAYLQLNYTPAPNSMIRGVEKLLPGHYRLIRDCSSGNPIVEERQYYQIPEKPDVAKMVDAESYQGAQKRLVKLLRESVRARMVSDVPLGAFLSGGIDSSVIATLATDYHSNLQTFSIGYQDEPRFDETEYAELVARKIGSHHTTFKLSHEDLFEHLHQVLDYLDEPFADSSALPVYILSQRTRNAVTVALSGDG